MTIQTEISRISGNVADALAAIAEKGVTVPPGSTSDALAELIAGIEAGGGGDTSVEDGLIARTVTEYSNNRVTSIGNSAFRDCPNLTTADFPLVTSIGSNAFYGCSNLTTVDFPAATSIGSNAFYNCSALTTADFPMAAGTGGYAFYDCSALTTVDFPAATSIDSNAFCGCSALTTVDFPAATSIGSNAFYDCSALTTADFPLVTSIGSNAFRGCSALTALILRRETVATLSSSNAFYYCCHILGIVDSKNNPDGLKDGYIYVPSALVARYQEATNWSTHSTQFRALEDYTVDGTITGELDPTKI